MNDFMRSCPITATSCFAAFRNAEDRHLWRRESGSYDDFPVPEVAFSQAFVGKTIIGSIRNCTNT